MEKVKNLISAKEASDISGYNPDYISQLIRSGKLQGKRIGRNWFTTKESVLENLSRKRTTVGKEKAPASKYVLMALLGGFIVAVFYTVMILYPTSGVADTSASDHGLISKSKVDTSIDAEPFSSTHQ